MLCKSSRIQFQLQFRIMYQNDKARYNSLNHVTATCGAEMVLNHGAHVHARYDENHGVRNLFFFLKPIRTPSIKAMLLSDSLSFMIVAQYEVSPALGV